MLTLSFRTRRVSHRLYICIAYSFKIITHLLIRLPLQSSLKYPLITFTQTYIYGKYSAVKWMQKDRGIIFGWHFVRCEECKGRWAPHLAGGGSVKNGRGTPVASTHYSPRPVSGIDNSYNAKRDISLLIWPLCAVRHWDETKLVSYVCYMDRYAKDQLFFSTDVRIRNRKLVELTLQWVQRNIIM